jgi:hypothetical protein
MGVKRTGRVEITIRSHMTSHPPSAVHMPKYYVFKDRKTCRMMYGSVHPAPLSGSLLGDAGSESWVDRVPLLLSNRSKVLTAGYCCQGVLVHSKFQLLAVTFYFQSMYFEGAVLFCQLATRSHLVVELR